MHIALLVFAFSLFGKAGVHRTLDADFSPSNATTLVIHVESGDLDLTPVNARRQAPAGGAPAGVIHIHGKIAAYSQSTANAVNFTATREGNRYVITVHEPHWPTHFNSRYRILYPAGMSVDVRDSSGDVKVHQPQAALSIYTSSGDLTIDAPQQAVQAYSASGDMHVDDAHSTLSLDTASGDVVASLASNWSGASITLKSSSGDVTLHVPSGFQGVLHAHTSSGDVINRAGLQKSGSGTPINVETASGDVVVK